jgi:hypothetical protein
VITFNAFQFYFFPILTIHFIKKKLIRKEVTAADSVTRGKEEEEKKKWNKEKKKQNKTNHEYSIFNLKR